MKACYGIRVYCGAVALLDLVESKKLNRRYPLESRVEYDVMFDDGILHVATAVGFMFDGRSGPSIIDWYAPNLGSLDERLLWHMHDCLGYAGSLDFWHTNRALRLGLRDVVGYRASKAWLIERAVSVSKSWYGVPDEDDWCHMNIGKVFTIWSKVATIGTYRSTTHGLKTREFGETRTHS